MADLNAKRRLPMNFLRHGASLARRDIGNGLAVGF